MIFTVIHGYHIRLRSSMVCSVVLVNLCSSDDGDDTVLPTISYEEYLSSKKVNPLVLEEVKF
jgi:hypothetical protein